MERRTVVGVLLIAAGCASAPIDPAAQPLPVYTEEQAPCEYEVVGRVRVRQPTGAVSFEDYRRRLMEALGREATRVEGAEAVIAPIADPNAGTGLARRREVGPGGPSIPPPFEAEAVRFLPGTCGG